MAVEMKSPIIICKICIFILGIVVMGIGLHSHFKSSWLRIEKTGIKPHRFCEFNDYVGGRFDYGVINFGNSEPCPKIAMERFYVAIVIIFFILSLINLILTFFLNYKARVVRMTDSVYHGIAGILIIIAGVVYLASAIQIKQLGIDVRWFVQFRPIKVDFLIGEKIVAAVLTMVLGLVYGITSAFVGKKSTSSTGSKIKGAVM